MAACKSIKAGIRELEISTTAETCIAVGKLIKIRKYVSYWSINGTIRYGQREYLRVV